MVSQIYQLYPKFLMKILGDQGGRGGGGGGGGSWLNHPPPENSLSIRLWSQHEKTYLLTCIVKEDSNQPAHPSNLISVFVFRMKKHCILGYQKCAKWRFWSDSANAQVDFNLRWAIITEGTFSEAGAQMICVSLHVTLKAILLYFRENKTWNSEVKVTWANCSGH